MRRFCFCLVAVLMSIAAHAADIEFNPLNVRSVEMIAGVSERGVTNIAGYVATNVVNDLADTAYSEMITGEIATAMNDMLGPNWRTTYGTGLVGILAAIFAALTWLKKRKVGSFTDIGTQSASVGDGGEANLSNFFGTGNTVLTSTITTTVPATAMRVTTSDSEVYELRTGAADPWDGKLDTTSQADSWVSTVTYAKGDFCTYGGKAFIATTTSTGSIPTGTGDWIFANLANQFSGENPSLMGVLPYGYNGITAWGGLTATDTYAADQSYAVGAKVLYDGTAYICHTAVSTSTTWATDSASFTTNYAAITDGAVNRLPTFAAGDKCVIELPIPATTTKTAEAIIRITQPATTVATIVMIPPSGKTFTNLEISGDTMAVAANYERLVTIIPTATANTYELVSTTRKIGA